MKPDGEDDELERLLVLAVKVIQRARELLPARLAADPSFRDRRRAIAYHLNGLARLIQQPTETGENDDG